MYKQFFGLLSIFLQFLKMAPAPNFGVSYYFQFPLGVLYFY